MGTSCFWQHLQNMHVRWTLIRFHDANTTADSEGSVEDLEALLATGDFGSSVDWASIPYLFETALHLATVCPPDPALAGTAAICTVSDGGGGVRGREWGKEG